MEDENADEIEVTDEMVKAGYYEYLAESRRLEDGEPEDHRIALTSIFRAMVRARK